MLYDLNVPWTPTTPLSTTEHNISFLTTLGYHTLALTHSLSSTSIPSQINNPIPILPSSSLPPNTTLLRRCTLSLSDPTQNHRLPALATAYDILALRPTTEKAYLAACNSISDHSIISLDLTIRYPFHWKPKPAMTAIKRGIRFEICYAQATSGDRDARRNFVGNLMGIVRATGGRGLVVSSGAAGVLEMRGPADVVNLLGVWGVGRERAVEGLEGNARGVVVNEGIKRRGFRGVVDVVEGGERVVEKKDDASKVEGQGVGKKDKGKRKADGDGDGTPQISKRQAKRMRLEALKAGKESSQKETPSSSKEGPSKNNTPSTDTNTSTTKSTTNS